jgi:hypothetical protein
MGAVLSSGREQESPDRSTAWPTATKVSTASSSVRSFLRPTTTCPSARSSAGLASVVSSTSTILTWRDALRSFPDVTGSRTWPDKCRCTAAREQFAIGAVRLDVLLRLASRLSSRPGRIRAWRSSRPCSGTVAGIHGVCPRSHGFPCRSHTHARFRNGTRIHSNGIPSGDHPHLRRDARGSDGVHGDAHDDGVRALRGRT